nr:uncharacterized protein LOC112726904 [Arachis hypogaea]
MGLYQGSENWTRPAGSTGLIANRRCKQSGPPLITAGEKIDELAKNRPVGPDRATATTVAWSSVPPLCLHWPLASSSLVFASSAPRLRTWHVDPPISNDDAANPNSRSANDSQSQGSSNLRGKIDLAWKYVALQTDMLDGVGGIGPGYKGPSYDKLRVHLLADLKRESQILVNSYRSAWKETGCTLMTDGWTGQRQRTLINFLVYCSKGLCFVKSVDMSSMIGPNDIVHVVTDNAANYVAAGRLINRKYDNIYWSLCAAHCLNLILKDISSKAHISNLATRASKITIFVYNHTVFLSWLRQKPRWREIVCPGTTRFVTVFITLKSIFDHKKELQALVVDSIFTDHKLGRSTTGRAVSAIILDCNFWDDCFTVCKLVGPLIYLLRVVDADDKPSLGYVYEGMLRIEDAIKEMFRQSKIAYQPYTDIINSRWDKHLKKDLHAATYFLNPKFFFNENYKEAPDVMRGFLDLVTLYCKCNNLDSVQMNSGGEIDADLYQSGGGSSSLYATSLDSSTQQSGNEGEDHPTEADLQQVLAEFDN